jgi:hypothetical protein
LAKDRPLDAYWDFVRGKYHLNENAKDADRLGYLQLVQVNLKLLNF